MSIINLPKILVIVGPTSSGKTSLSIKLAKRFNGEVVSADSRQVYKGMDFGTGKVTKKEMQSIKHYLLDVVSPKTQFSAAKFVKLADKAIKEIIKKGKLPIICGGTGFWVEALLYGLNETVAPDWQLRKKLEKLSAEELLNKLSRISPERARNIDPHNKRRLIRALEIALLTKKPVLPVQKNLRYDALQLGIVKDREVLNKLIRQRLLARIKQGMIKEVAGLHKNGVSWQKLDDFGLEYRYVSRFLRGLLTKEQMLEQLEIASRHYAKRQMTWFKREKNIHWLKDLNKASKLVENWL